MVGRYSEIYMISHKMILIKFVFARMLICFIFSKITDPVWIVRGENQHLKVYWNVDFLKPWIFFAFFISIILKVISVITHSQLSWKLVS